MYLLGFDPGGENAFGWAVAHANQQRVRLVKWGVCTGADTAINTAAEHVPEPPDAIGIDAPLFWVFRGDRKADAKVRTLVCAAGGSSGTVSHVNSLRGACLVQGALAANISHSKWPSAQITEAHPKALLAVSASARNWLAELNFGSEIEHARDAAIAAYSAYALISKFNGWQNLAALETNPFFPAGVKVDYYFPTART